MVDALTSIRFNAFSRKSKVEFISGCISTRGTINTHWTTMVPDILVVSSSCADPGPVVSKDLLISTSDVATMSLTFIHSTSTSTVVGSYPSRMYRANARNFLSSGAARVKYGDTYCTPQRTLI